MKKLIAATVLAATAVVGIGAATTGANASVSYEATNDGYISGHIDKPDVQRALGELNEAQVQSTPMKFTTTFTTTTDTSWLTASGERLHNVKTLTFTQDLKASEVRQGAGQKIKAWDLTGLNGLTFVKQEVTGSPLYAGFAGGLQVEQSHDFGDDLFVNGVLLPETPVEVAPAA